VPATLFAIPTKAAVNCILHCGIVSLFAALAFYWVAPGIWATALKTLIFWAALSAVGLGCLCYAYHKAARASPKKYG
jgi:hypothetical protein